MVFSGDDAVVGTARAFVHAGDCVIRCWDVPPGILVALADRTLAAQRPIVADTTRASNSEAIRACL
jgi:hypothetical protein